MHIKDIAHPKQTVWDVHQSTVVPELKVLPWHHFVDEFVSPCDLTAIFSPLYDAGSDSNHQIPEKQGYYHVSGCSPSLCNPTIHLQVIKSLVKFEFTFMFTCLYH